MFKISKDHYERSFKVYLIFFILSICFTGCATYVNPIVHSVTDGHFEKKSSKLTILIPEEDLKQTRSAHFGIVGLLFPVSVEVGNTLQRYSISYFSKMFSDITINEKVTENALVILTFKDVSVSALDGRARLELRMEIKNRSGSTVLDKTYSGEGSGHFPIYCCDAYTAARAQENQIRKTTEEVFEKVFNEIMVDVEKLDI